MDANIIKVYRIPSIIVFISRWIINGPQAPKFYTFEPARKIMMMNWITLSISVPNEHAWWKCNINHSSWRTQEPALLSFLFRLSRHNRHIHPKELSLWWNTASPGRRGNCDMDFADTVGCCPLLLNCAERAVCCSWRAVWSPLTSKMCLLRHFCNVWNELWSSEGWLLTGELTKWIWLYFGSKPSLSVWRSLNFQI